MINIPTPNPSPLRREGNKARGVELLKPHTGGQRAVYLHPARFKIVACGRGWGKTFYGKIEAVKTIVEENDLVWWISPTYKMSTSIWRWWVTHFGQAAEWVSSQDRMLILPDGGALTVWTASSPDTIRGERPRLVIFDEAAMIRSGDMWYSAVRPALSRPGEKQGRALFLSTTRGHNWFWDLWNMGNDPLFPEYKSFQFPSWYMPFVPKSEFEQVRQTLPERFFRQEYGAEFIPDAGGVFRGVMEVSTLEYRPHPPAPSPSGRGGEGHSQRGGIPTPSPSPLRKEGNNTYVFGVDWGRENDFTVVSVFDRDTKQQVDMDRFNKISWELQRGRLRAMYEKWKPSVIWAEENSIGGPNIEALQREGLPVRPFAMTAQSKPELIESLALAIERREIGLLNDRVQVAELQAYEMTRLPSGTFRYNAPDGGHDDTVIAAALGWHGCKYSGVRVLF